MALPQRSWGRKPIAKQEQYVCTCGKKCKTFAALESHWHAQRFSHQGHSFSHWTKHGTVMKEQPNALDLQS
jgi:hypothetical protein